MKEYSHANVNETSSPVQLRILFSPSIGKSFDEYCLGRRAKRYRVTCLLRSIASIPPPPPCLSTKHSTECGERWSLREECEILLRDQLRRACWGGACGTRKSPPNIVGLTLARHKTFGGKYDSGIGLNDERRRPLSLAEGEEEE